MVNRPALLLSLALALSACQPENRLLEELDGYVARSEEFRHRKEHQLEALRSLYRTARDPEVLADVALQSADAYFSFRYDSARFYLNRCLDLSAERGDAVRYQSALG